MADAKWMKRAPLTEREADDPFAELTRIMGFDPRVPFRTGSEAAAPAAPQQVAAPNVDVRDEDLDFSIDLEQELMGALNDDEPAMAAAAPSARTAETGYPNWQRQAPMAAPEVLSEEPSLDEQAYADFVTADDDAYAPSGDVVPFQPVSAQFAPRQLAYRDEVAEEEVSEDDDAIAYAFDDAIAADDDDRYEQDRYQDDRAAQSMQQTQAVAAYEQLEDEGRDHSAALVAELDDALGASFESELADDDDWAVETETSSAVMAAAPVAPVSTGFVSRPAGGFDDSMAEVDMDFSSTPMPAHAVSAGGQMDETEYADERQSEPLFADFEDDLEASLSGEFAEQELELTTAEIEDDWQQDMAEAPVARHVVSAPQEDDDTPAPYFPSAPRFEDEDDQAYAAAPEEDVAESEIDDAIAELAAMVRSYDRPAPAQEAVASVSNLTAPAESADDFPEIETIDVPEDAIALADDLDLPDLEYDDSPAPSFDDLDAELAAAFGEPAVEPVQVAKPAEPIELPFDLDGGYDANAGRSSGVAEAAGYAAAGAAAAMGARQMFAQSGQPAGRRAAQSDAFDVDPDMDDDFDFAGDPELVEPRRSPRKGLMIASVVGGIAVLGVIGAFAFSGGGSLSGEPVLVKADSDPVKVKPENPGGAVVPNQESRVFDRAAGEAPQAPAQQTLISNEEEPVDVAAQFPEELPAPVDETADIDELVEGTPKAEERVEQATAQATPAAEETVAVEPRKVRTMVVKPDGSLVPREEIAPAEQPETVGSTTAAGSLTDPTVSTPPADAQPLEQAPVANAPAQPAAEAAPAATASAETQPAAPRTTNSTTPRQVPVAPSRPAEQPLDIVGEVKADQVAAIDPATTAPAAGAWSMQIASQPSEAAAQSSYQDLARRYSKVLGGRSASIVKAEIAGKGTFWRVRVPAGSRNEAVSLCESYKAAGGNCFVSK